MKANRFREVAAAGRIPIGHMIIEFGTRGVAKILEAADLDFVVYDMEHSGFDIDRIFDLIAWSKATPLAPFVRVPQAQYHFIARIMDAGGLGIMAPNVETPEQARAIIEAMKYAPVGKRGVGLGTAHNDYVIPKPAEYFVESNANSVLICQIESELGVRNSAAIAALPEVDCLWVGHFDLSHSLGIPGQFAHERFQAALREVVAGARQHGKLLGVQPASSEMAEQWRQLGFNVFSWQSDIALYRGALQAGVKDLRCFAAPSSAAG